MCISITLYSVKKEVEQIKLKNVPHTIFVDQSLCSRVIL